MIKQSFPKESEIVSEDENGNKTITSPDGYSFIAVRGSINATPHPVGTKGQTIWVRGGCWSLPYFILP